MPEKPKKTAQARLELPADRMEEVRKAAEIMGMTLSAFIRLAVWEKTRKVHTNRD